MSQNATDMVGVLQSREPTNQNPTNVPARDYLVLQPHFVVISLSALVVGLLGAVLVASTPLGPGPGHGAVEWGGDQVCQETFDLAQRD
ncbi:hypothetical protein Atai01_76990 [Amycolatopsis taiwanensis]|uniref:Uncharacterized protein n=1 Tax=Amycolatopsis taiwanensis TaxID=342230 RepID=A0A9W6RBT9_9PSEU|nr:hypothetical protein Atai01_76990 [Amycolatopsis taiwanensis]